MQEFNKVQRIMLKGTMTKTEQQKTRIQAKLRKEVMITIAGWPKSFRPLF